MLLLAAINEQTGLQLGMMRVRMEILAETN